MTTVIIKSDSDKKTLLLMQLAEELGLRAEAKDMVDLNVESMVKGIGRKATDEEFINYLEKGLKSEPIGLDTAFAKYEDRK